MTHRERAEFILGHVDRDLAEMNAPTYEKVCREFLAAVANRHEASLQALGGSTELPEQKDDPQVI